VGDGTKPEQLVADINRRIDGDELDRLAEAKRVSGAIHANADSLVDRFVREARDAGRTWAEIAVSLGVSKQAAQQRSFRRSLHTVRASMNRQARAGRPFGKAARLLTLRADREARVLGHDYVGCEHLFLALLADQKARSVLEGAGLPVDLVEEHLKELAKSWSGPGDGVRSPTPRLERVLDLASQWAHVTEAAEVGVEELLLAVLDSREASGVIEYALVRKGGTSSMLLSTTVKSDLLHL
jgi:hypothetical protein